MQASWAAMSLGTWSVFIVLAIYAFDAGGAAAVGVAALVRMLPAGLSAPFTSLLADRRSRRDLLYEAAVVQAAGVALIVAAVALDAPLGVVLALAAVQSIACSAANPAQASLLPLLARSPEQLAAANVATYGIESAGYCLGSVLGGGLVATAGVTTGLAAAAAAFALAVVALRGCCATRRRRTARRARARASRTRCWPASPPCSPSRGCGSSSRHSRSRR